MQKFLGKIGRVMVGLGVLCVFIDPIGGLAMIVGGSLCVYGEDNGESKPTSKLKSYDLATEVEDLFKKMNIK